jgi:hypothetical protein
LKEDLLIIASDLPNGFALPARPDQQLIFSRVSIRGQMPDIGDIHDVFDIIAKIF